MRKNRARLFVLGDGSKKHVAALTKIGFRPDYVERWINKQMLAKLPRPKRLAPARRWSRPLRK
jgi:hypothetical protein